MYPGPGDYAGPGFYPRFYGMLQWETHRHWATSCHLTSVYWVAGLFEVRTVLSSMTLFCLTALRIIIIICTALWVVTNQPSSVIYSDRLFLLLCLPCRMQSPCHETYSSGWLTINNNYFFKHNLIFLPWCFDLYRRSSSEEVCLHLFLATSHHYRGKNLEEEDVNKLLLTKISGRDRNVKVKIWGCAWRNSCYYSELLLSSLLLFPLFRHNVCRLLHL